MASEDLFEFHSPSLLQPWTRAVAVTPSDTADLPFVTRALWVGTGGDVGVVTLDGDTEVIPSVPGGTYLVGRLTRVRATGTTASGLVAHT